MRSSHLQAHAVDIVTPAGRMLFRDLSLAMDREHAAIVGRNGVGKSSLLRVLAGDDTPARGRVARRGRVGFVPQLLAGEGGSGGERRRAALEAAFAARPDVLLLDEPTQDLDALGIDWLLRRVAAFDGALVVASHHRALLDRMRHFLLVAEAGCRHVEGSLADVEAEVSRQHARDEQRYQRALATLAQQHREHEAICRRRARKKNLGRLHEERRAPSKAQLKGKKGYAQASQAKAAGIRKRRLEADRQRARRLRRALAVQLPLAELVAPLPEAKAPVVTLQGVADARGGRVLFEDLDLAITRQRIAITGPIGAGKTSLLSVITGEREPSDGVVRRRLGAIGSIGQGGHDWLRPESLRDLLGDAALPSALAHRFPAALTERPLASLSPGERIRAALVCLMHRGPELLVLDEPAASLDFFGASALIGSLKAWVGALVLTSHDRRFLQAVGIDHEVAIGGGHRR